MREVNHDEFYKGIGELDVCLRTEDERKYPFTTLFEMRHTHELVGKIVGSYPDNGNKWPVIERYYLSK